MPWRTRTSSWVGVFSPAEGAKHAIMREGDVYGGHYFEVSGQSMDSALDQNQAKFAVLVFSVPLQMFPHLNGFLDHVVEIFRNLGRQSVHPENTQDLVAGDGPHLCDPMLISKRPPNVSDVRQHKIE